MKTNLTVFKTDDNNNIVITKTEKIKYLQIKRLCKKMDYKNYVYSNGSITVKNNDGGVVCAGSFHAVYRNLSKKFQIIRSDL